MSHTPQLNSNKAKREQKLKKTWFTHNKISINRGDPKLKIKFATFAVELNFKYLQNPKIKPRRRIFIYSR